MIEKAKLTTEFLTSSLDFYNKIRNQYEKEFNKIKKQKPSKIILIGISEFTEIAILAAKITEVKIDYIVESNFKKKKFCDISIKTNINRFLNLKQNVFFVLSSQKGISNILTKIPKNRYLVKPDFLLLS